MATVHTAIRALCNFINRLWITVTPTPRQRLLPAVHLQAALGFVFLHCARRRALGRFRRYCVRPPASNTSTSTWYAKPAIYLFIQFDGSGHYIGRSVAPLERYFQHFNDAHHSLWRSVLRGSHEDVFHARIASAGPGSFLFLRLVVYDIALRASPARRLLDAAQAHTERCFLFRLAARDPNALNVVHTWRMRSVSRHQRLRFMMALCQIDTTVPASADVTTRCWREPRSHWEPPATNHRVWRAACYSTARASRCQCMSCYCPFLAARSSPAPRASTLPALRGTGGHSGTSPATPASAIF
eukprot:SAG25_NODE_3398_length_1096_cov_0.700100_1_plen_298_part_10